MQTILRSLLFRTIIFIPVYVLIALPMRIIFGLLTAVVVALEQIVYMFADLYRDSLDFWSTAEYLWNEWRGNENEEADKN